MTIRAITLTDPVSGNSSTIRPRDGIGFSVLDVAATARAQTTVNDRVGAHGSSDVTQYLTEAAVSLTLTLYNPVQVPGSIGALWDEISALLDPGLRPVLIVDNDDWAGPRQMTVRFDSDSKPIQERSRWVVQVSWKAPGAVWESVAETEVLINYFAPAVSGVIETSTGAIFTSGGLIMLGEAGPVDTIVSGGSAPAQWQCRLYGPCTGPALISDTAGAKVAFTSALTINAGDYVLLDSELQTATASDGVTDLTGLLDFTLTDWWLLAPGSNLIRFAPLSGSPGSLADLVFRQSFKA